MTTGLHVPERSLRVFVADDEPAARDKLLRLLRAQSGVDVVGAASDGASAAAAIRSLAPDVAILDIRVPELDGFAALERLEPHERAALHVVFVTAYDEYAVRAFEVRALDYLLKPFDAARLAETLDRVRRQLELERRPDSASLRAVLTQLQPPIAEAELESQPQRYVDRICIKSAGRIQFVRAGEVEWIEAYGNYVRLHTATEHPLARETMRRLLEQLDPSDFQRIHRSAIANLRCIREVTPAISGDSIIRMQSGIRLRLSRSYRAEVVRRLAERGTRR